jgi:hypothetical protein
MGHLERHAETPHEHFECSVIDVAGGTAWSAFPVWKRLIEQDASRAHLGESICRDVVESHVLPEAVAVEPLFFAQLKIAGLSTPFHSLLNNDGSSGIRLQSECDCDGLVSRPPQPSEERGDPAIVGVKGEVDRVADLHAQNVDKNRLALGRHDQRQ